MKERPILFQGAMVRALLDGSKTQTRRIMKPQPSEIDGEPGKHWWPSNQHQTMLRVEDEMQKWTGLAGDACPYGDDGDRLWVRETYMPDPEDDGTWAYTQYMGCKGSPLSDIPARFRKSEHCLHRATWDGVELVGWKPSIHMPRWASRILLEIVSVRVERLNDISEADAVAEGVTLTDDPAYFGIEGEHLGLNARESYSKLWEAINGPGSVEANPWVWVIEFKRVAP